MRKLILLFFLSVFFIPSLFSQETESALYNEVMSAYNSGFLPGCVDKATNLEKNYPESSFLPPALLKKGECYVRMGQAENAIVTLDRVQLQLYVGGDGYAESFYWKGRAKLLNKKYSEAEDCFKICCSSIGLQNSNNQTFYFNSLFYIGKANYEQCEYEDAIRYFEYVVNNGKKYKINEYYESLQKLAMCYNNTQNYQKTVDLYDKITERINAEGGEKFDKKVYQSLGDRAADAKTAMGSLEDALKLYHDNADMLSDFYIRLGIKEFEDGNFSKAEEYFLEAEKKQKDKNKDLIKLYRARMMLTVGMKVTFYGQNKTESRFVKIDETKSDEEIVENILQAHKLLLEINLENLDSEYKNSDKVYYSSLSKADFFLANFTDIKNRFTKISETSELTDDVLYITVLAYYFGKNYKEAAELLENVYANREFSLYPKQTELYALNKANAGDYKSAIAAYELLEQDGKLTENTKINYAILLQKIARNENNTKTQNEQYEKAYNLTKELESAKGLAVSGDSALSLFRNTLAIQIYEKALLASDLTSEIEESVLFNKGFAEHRLWYENKNYRAEKTFNKYQEKYPTGMYVPYTYNICAIEAYSARDKQKSIYYSEMCVKTAQNTENHQTALQRLASVYLDYQMYDKAISVYEPYVNGGNDFAVESMYKIAEIYAKSGNTQKSAETYYNLYQKYFTSKYAEESLFRSGEVLYLVSDYENASKYFEKYTEKYPNGKYSDTVLYYVFDSFVQTNDITKAILNGKTFIQKHPENTFAYSVLQGLLKIYIAQDDYNAAYDVAKKLQVKNGNEKDAELEKTIARLEKIIGGGNVEIIKAETDYENAGGSSTINGRKKGTELAKIYNKNDDTKKQAFSLAKELLSIQQKNLINECDCAAENALIIASYYYDTDNKSDAAENYLLAAEYFRMDNNDEKAASCLYTATECFVHQNKKGDAAATAKLLKQLYPETRYAKAVNNLLR